MATAAEVRALTNSTLESLRLTELCQRAKEDQEYQQLKQYIHNRFPSHTEQYYNRHAHTLPEVSVGTIGGEFAVQNPTTKHWDIYGVVTAVGPFRQYHIKTSNGRVLIRNRCYIRRRVPIVPTTVQNISPNKPPAPLGQSTRQHRRPLRYNEEFAS